MIDHSRGAEGCSSQQSKSNGGHPLHPAPPAPVSQTSKRPSYKHLYVCFSKRMNIHVLLFTTPDTRDLRASYKERRESKVNYGENQGYGVGKQVSVEEDFIWRTALGAVELGGWLNLATASLENGAWSYRSRFGKYVYTCQHLSIHRCIQSRWFLENATCGYSLNHVNLKP